MQCNILTNIPNIHIELHEIKTKLPCSPPKSIIDTPLFKNKYHIKAFLLAEVVLAEIFLLERITKQIIELFIACFNSHNDLVLNASLYQMDDVKKKHMFDLLCFQQDGACHYVVFLV